MKENLLQKKEELEMQKRDIEQSLIAIIGAMQFCDSLIKELEETETKTE